MEQHMDCRQIVISRNKNSVHPQIDSLKIEDDDIWYAVCLNMLSALVLHQ